VDELMKNVLYVSYDGMTDPLGQSQVLPYLVGLSKLGYRFWLLSCEKPDRFQQNKEIIEQITSANNIYWTPVPYTKSPPILSTLKDVRRLKKQAVKLHKKINFDLVHCRSYIGSLAGVHLKKKFGVKYLFDMRGFWADEKVDAGHWNLKNPLYNAIYSFFKKKEKAFIENADHIISLTDSGLKEMQAWKHVQVDKNKVEVIPCCVDVQLFDIEKIDQAEKHKMAKVLGIKNDQTIISYLGSIGTWYMLNEMLAFFKAYKKRTPGARLLFITQDEHKLITEQALLIGLSASDIILKGAKRNEVPLLLSLSKYSLFFIRPTYSKSASSPTKQGEIMAMGIPAICNAGVGDTDIIINQYQSGILVQDMTGEEFEKTIDSLLYKTFEPAKIRAGAINYFALEIGLKRYAQVYSKILS
jgi:glycosyltransferase involved in cell wall biosynthesis